jgi:hypothetical protein
MDSKTRYSQNKYSLRVDEKPDILMDSMTLVIIWLNHIAVRFNYKTAHKDSKTFQTLLSSNI